MLLSGDHAAIRRWRRQQSLGRTWLRRPDLLARAQLDNVDAALIPAVDGGYVLIGVRGTHPNMFNGIDWGEATVLAAQRDRFRTLGWRWHEGANRWDVDRPEDLARLLELDPPLAVQRL